jgi:hypothetical protein
MLAGQISMNPRFMYEFFDEQGMYISINNTIDSYFEFSVNDAVSVKNFEKRVEAEREAFLSAFELTESKQNS